MHVLVIDDEGVIRNLAEKILTKAGHRVELAKDGVEGVDVFRENHDDVNLLLIDLTMEGVTGGEVLRQCRIINPDIPALFSSGRALESDDIPDDLATNTSFLQKPYKASELIEAVGEFAVTAPAN